MDNENIPYDEVIFQGLSFTDLDRLFTWNGTLFRGISSERASFCRNLFSKGIMQELIAKKLFVETEITPLKIDHYEIVLKHRTIPFVSYPQEWCDVMLKDAALHQLDFCLELINHNLESEDAHPLNILFEGCHPVFVDFGSIAPVPANTSRLLWTPYEQFCRVYMRPLRLMAHGHTRIARWLLHDYEFGILKSDIDALICPSLLRWINSKNIFFGRKSSASLMPPFSIRGIVNKINLLGKHSAPDASNHLRLRRAFLEKIRKDLASIKLAPEPLKASSSNNGTFSPPSPFHNPANSHHLVTAVLSDLRPASLLSIGRYNHSIDASLIAARNGSQVVALFPDAANVRVLYATAKSNALPILPLQMNLFSPSNDFSNYWFKPASERLRCDFVLALDLIDISIRDKLPFDLIVRRLSTLSKRWLLLDFNPIKDHIDRDLILPQPFRYTLENLMDELRKAYSKVDIISPASHESALLLCEK